MKTIINPKKSDWPELMKRPVSNTQKINEIVRQVFDEVKRNGDEALFKYTHFFDKADVDEFRVPEAEILNAQKYISAPLKNAINIALSNIELFHKSQQVPGKVVTTSTGVSCWQETRPIEKVGLYIPGGTAPLFSTVLMLGIPAKIAGCREIILCTPPDKNGKINPAILYAANLVGINTIFKIGGIQAIAAMTFGSESIPKVYKIFGPGNQYVTASKMKALEYGIAIDMPAGPSELLVVADKSANPAFVAADLLSQAEHGADSQVICIANAEDILINIQREIQIQINELPRKEIAAKALENSKLMVISSKQDAIDFINDYAPEHLILAVEDEGFYLDKLMNAGSVFIGNYAPESAGDYASGTNHTLPTNGYAKAYSGVGLSSFQKTISFQKISSEGIAAIGPAIEKMAIAEGLMAHKNAVTVRLRPHPKSLSQGEGLNK